MVLCSCHFLHAQAAPGLDWVLINGPQVTLQLPTTACAGCSWPRLGAVREGDCQRHHGAAEPPAAVQGAQATCACKVANNTGCIRICLRFHATAEDADPLQFDRRQTCSMQTTYQFCRLQSCLRGLGLVSLRARGLSGVAGLQVS
jgi:hypothetical protein